jgi:ParB family chromosome partitioning protein
MTMKKRGLGRGLDVLIKSRVVEPERDAEIVTLDIDALSPNAHQPRHHFDETALEELAASIKAQGLIQPVLVRPAETAGKYEIVAGERRWRASKMAGLARLDCIVRPMDDYESMAIALIENLQREDLNPMEEARALGQIKEHFQITQEDLADKIGKSRPAVTNCLRLLKLPDSVQAMLEGKILSAGHARALLGIEDPKAMEFLAGMVQTKELTVRATEELVKKFKNNQASTLDKGSKKKTLPLDIQSLTQNLGSRHHFKIACSGTETKGRIVLSYATAEERERIAVLLGRMTAEEPA